MGRDHSCESCGAGGFNNDEKCECAEYAVAALVVVWATDESDAERQVTEMLRYASPTPLYYSTTEPVQGSKEAARDG